MDKKNILYRFILNMKFFMIKKMFLNNKKMNNKNDKKGGNFVLLDDLNKNLSNLDINGGSVIYRNKYKSNKIKLNI
jgi:hypothetical protein